MSEANVLKPLMPPYGVYRDFLDTHAHEDLLAWAIENEPRFEPTKVTSGRTDRRKSLLARDFEPIETMLRQRVLELVPTLLSDLRVPQFELSEVTTELVAHNDGAFFKRHIDRFYDVGQGAPDRMLTAIYYFHAEPKAFSGGALRLYPFGTQDETTFIDVWPEQNTLLAFPSSAPHEVLPVKCPSRRFADSRFAANLWINGRDET